MIFNATFGSDFFIIASIVVMLLILITIFRSKIRAVGLSLFSNKVRTGVYLKKTFRTKSGKLKYRILYPNGFDNTKKYPLLLFLHGAGERGNNNKSQLAHGGELIKNGMNIHQSIAIFPQCPDANYWIELLDFRIRPNGIRDFEPDYRNPPSKALGKVIALLKKYTENSFLDKSRIYVAGLSMGGMGTFDLCWRMPEMFAAAIAVCGTGPPLKARKFASMPIRIYHGDSDEIVYVEESIDMAEALLAAGGDPEVFIYPDVGHNSWDNAFAEPDFLSWLYEQKK